MSTHPEVGDTAPEFEALTDTGQQVKLSDYRGKKVILYFYPRDDTPGCTIQACGFRDNISTVEEHSAVILGISPDNQASHQAFKAKFNLPFALLVDEGHAIAEQYGVWAENTSASTGKTYMGNRRSHFVIDETGKIIDARVPISPEDSVTLALEMISAQ